MNRSSAAARLQGALLGMGFLLAALSLPPRPALASDSCAAHPGAHVAPTSAPFVAHTAVPVAASVVAELTNFRVPVPGGAGHRTALGFHAGAASAPSSSVLATPDAAAPDPDRARHFRIVAQPHRSTAPPR